MDAKKTVESTQEQAVASWINYLNQVRIERLLEDLSFEKENLDEAMSSLNDALKKISSEIVERNRGGDKGMHGFIAEVAECGIGNAKSQIEGKAPVYEWINDNGPSDLKRGAIYIQQKFVNGGNHLSLQAIKMHYEKYPDYLDNGNLYQIPADHYEKIKELLSIPKEEAYKMPTSTGEFSLKQWKEVHEFFEDGNIRLESLEPSELDYKSVQRNTYEESFDKAKKDIKDRNTERRNEVYQKSKPTIEEGAKATVISAAIEGSMALCLEIIAKKKEGKGISDFDGDDWKDIIGKTGWGTLKGGVRGAGIYALSNYSASPAAVASAFITASFGVAEQAHLFRNGKISELEFIDNAENLCLDATISAVSSLLGEILIPIPVVGAVIGNTAGMFLYQIAKDGLSDIEGRIIDGYIEENKRLAEQLDAEYFEFIKQLNDNMKLFLDIIERAFSPDVRVAFEGSIELAREMGVPEGEILDTQEKINDYFTR